MSKYKRLRSAVPVRNMRAGRRPRKPITSTLPRAGKVMGLPPSGYLDTGFVRKAYPRIAYALIPSDKQPGQFDLLFSEWVQNVGETLPRTDLNETGFATQEQAYDYIHDLQLRLSENPAYVNE